MNDLLIRFRKHYLPVLVLSLVTVYILSFVFTKRDAITFTAQSTGYIALILLAFSLVLGTINLIRKKRNPVSTYFRRDISIIGGSIALIHSVTGLFVHLRGKTWLYFLNKTENGFSIRLDHFGLANYTGLIAAIILLILLISSNDYFFRNLGAGRWKNIQRLTYIMFILTIIHSILYRAPKAKPGMIFSFYLPVTLIVLAFQITGIILMRKLEKKRPDR